VRAITATVTLKFQRIAAVKASGVKRAQILACLVAFVSRQIAVAFAVLTDVFLLFRLGIDDVRLDLIPWA
jgi:hypothetical protein